MKKKIASMLMLITMLLVSVLNSGTVFAASKSKVYVDGIEKPVQSSKKAKKPKQSEKQLIISAARDMSCSFRDTFNSLDFENLSGAPQISPEVAKKLKEEAEAVFEKYDIKTDEKSMAVLGEKYKGDIKFIYQILQAMTSCGRQETPLKLAKGAKKSEKESIIAAYEESSCGIKKFILSINPNNSSLPEILGDATELKKKANIIFKKHGFPVEDDEKMLAIIKGYFKEKGFVYDVLQAAVSCKK